MADLKHIFDSSMTCDFCGIAEERAVAGEHCPERTRKASEPPRGVPSPIDFGPPPTVLEDLEPPRWEYCVEERSGVGQYWDEFLELSLKRLGEEGWELLHITERRNHPFSQDVSLKGYFKRQVRN